MILKALHMHLPCDFVWQATRAFSYERAACIVASAAATHAPVLMTFRIRHRDRDWGGTHCVIATSCDRDGIHCLDTLGPRDGAVRNVTIEPSKVEGCWR